MNPKRKGNAFEREIAKLLGRWLYGDDHALRRNTGEPEDVYIGDIVPYRSDPRTSNFNYYVQCKTGYKRHCPDFWNFSLIKKWLTEALHKTEGHFQNIIFLVVRFKNRPILLFTNNKIDGKDPILILPVNNGGHFVDFYMYNFKKLIT